MVIHRSAWLYLLFGIVLTSCHISAKMDRFVSEQYNDQFPRISGKKNQEIKVTTNLPADKQQAISTTQKKTSKVLPLIVYWSFDYRRTCSLNYQVPLNLITNSLYTTTNKKLEEKIKGKILEIQIEQVPRSFAIVDKAHIALLIYWDKLYREPDFSDLVVNYKLVENANTIKSEYNQELSSMSKRLMEKLAEEL